MKYLPLLAASASGKLGGIVFSHNRGGTYIRQRVVPTNPGTTFQTNVRNVMANLAIAWQTELTQAQRDGWEVYAQNVPVTDVIGESITLTGINMYVRSNTAVFQAGLTRVDDAPTDYTLAQAEQALAATASEATQIVSVTFDDTLAWVDLDGAAELIYIGVPQNSGIAFFKGPYRFAGVLLGSSTTPPTSPAAIAAPFPFAETNHLWIQTRILLPDGRLSVRAQADFLAAA